MPWWNKDHAHGHGCIFQPNWATLLRSSMTQLSWKGFERIKTHSIVKGDWRPVVAWMCPASWTSENNNNKSRELIHWSPFYLHDIDEHRADFNKIFSILLLCISWNILPRVSCFLFICQIRQHAQNKLDSDDMRPVLDLRVQRKGVP
jgi:hypothetical protein